MDDTAIQRCTRTKGKISFNAARRPAANSARRFNPDLREYFEGKVRAGKPHGIAVSAVSRKLVARIYVVLNEEPIYQVRYVLTLHRRSFQRTPCRAR